MKNLASGENNFGDIQELYWLNLVLGSKVDKCFAASHRATR